MDAADNEGAAARDAGARDALEQRFAERLLDDEALRADLTDDEFQPLQDWALEQLHARASALADPSAPEAETELASVVDDLREVLRGVNDAVGQRLALDAQAFANGLASIVGALQPPLYGAEEPAAAARQAVEAALPALAAHKDDADAVELVQALVSALRPSDARPETPDVT
jgi:hypothetical protein